MDSDSLIGVPFRQAARVIGVAEQRLRRWNAIGLVLPSIVGSVGSRHYWSYGLEDIVQGRVVRDLEDRGVHIRAIRRIVEAVRSATTPRPLAELTWGVADGEAFVQYPDGGWVGNRRPVQGVMVEVLNLELLRAAARKEILLRPQHLAGEFEKRRGTLGSKRVFAGTRIPLDAVAAYLRRHSPEAEILQAFPDLTHEDIEAARRELASA